MEEIYDVIIVGAGPAGMNASLYTSRANMTTLMIEKECPGGKMMKTKVIDNYIGSSSNDAMKLASDMFAQSIKYGAKYKQGNVVSIEDLVEYKRVMLSSGESFLSKALILAIGGKLSNDVFKYDYYLNKGLSYCVVCDANFYKDKVVALIGDDKAIEDVDYLSNIAKKVYFINKDNHASNKRNVENFINIKEYKILGQEKVENVEVNNKILEVDGVFYVNDTNSFNGFVENLEIENGYVKVDNNMHTNIEGIYACGDIVNKNIKQVISACGDGALAALEAIKYINKRK